MFFKIILKKTENYVKKYDAEHFRASLIEILGMGARPFHVIWSSFRRGTRRNCIDVRQRKKNENSRFQHSFVCFLQSYIIIQ